MKFFGQIAGSFTQGGFWMYVILAFQVIAIAIIVERCIALYLQRKPKYLGVVKDYEELIKKGDLKAVEEKAEESKTPLAQAIAAGVRAARNLGGKDEIQGKMDEVLLAENTAIERRTPFLAMLANVGTLTGLLGTIIGMIKSFAAVSYANPMEKATLLSSGISEAMNTTAYGLVMAIPTLVLFAVLTNRSTVLSDDLNQAALKAYNWLSYAYEPVPLRQSRNERGKDSTIVNA